MSLTIIHRPKHQAIIGCIIFVAAGIFGTTALSGGFEVSDLGFLYTTVLPLFMIALSLIMHTAQGYHRVIYELARSGLDFDQIKNLLLKAGFDEIKINSIYPDIRNIMATKETTRFESYLVRPKTETERGFIILKTFLGIFTFIGTLFFFLIFLANRYLYIGALSKQSIYIFNTIIFILMLINFGSIEQQNSIFYKSKLSRFKSFIPHIIVLLIFFIVLPFLAIYHSGPIF